MGHALQQDAAAGATSRRLLPPAAVPTSSGKPAVKEDGVKLAVAERDDLQAHLHPGLSRRRKLTDILSLDGKIFIGLGGVNDRPLEEILGLAERLGGKYYRGKEQEK